MLGGLDQRSREMVTIPRDELECRKVKEKVWGVYAWWWCMPGTYHLLTILLPSARRWSASPRTGRRPLAVSPKA